MYIPQIRIEHEVHSEALFEVMLEYCRFFVLNSGNFLPQTVEGLSYDHELVAQHSETET